MSGPANISFATATLINTLPYDYTQGDINDSGVNYTVYYKFVAPLNSKVVGAWGFSGNIASGYRPTIYVYDKDQVAVLGIAAQNKPIQFPVNAGEIYYLKFLKNTDTAGPEDLRIQVEAAPVGTVIAGNIVVNDDATGFPLAVLSHLVDNTIIGFYPGLAAGEAGDILKTGVIALENSGDNTIKVYNSSFVQIASLSVAANHRLRAQRTAAKFYYGTNTSPVVVGTILSTGSFGLTTWSLTGNNSINALAANNDESILYFANNGYGVAVKRWDLVGNTGLTDFIAAVAGYRIPDILVQDDGSIIILYHSNSTQDVFARRYNAAGTLLNTYSLGVQTYTVMPRLAYALDDSNSFWVWTHNTGGVSIFRNVKCSDGSIITTRLQTEYEGGVYLGAETASPTARFGNSYSCPFFIMELPTPPTPVVGGIYYIHPDKVTRHDSYYEDIEKKIPNPTFRTAFVGE